MFTKAAEKGEAEAQYNLGHMYHYGLGVSQDYNMAFNLIKKAAEHDYTLAQCILGNLYCDGHGTPQDYVEAYKWFLLADVDKLADADNKDVAEAKEELSAKMTPAQIAEAEKRAKEFVAKKEKVSDVNSPDIK